MESKGGVLDEAKLDAAIADILKSESKPEPQMKMAEPAKDEAEETVATPEFLDDSDVVVGFTASLRQKWAELVGAA